MTSSLKYCLFYNNRTQLVSLETCICITITSLFSNPFFISLQSHVWANKNVSTYEDFKLFVENEYYKKLSVYFKLFLCKNKPIF